ncbi:hypothetical protein [Roseiterribacter gracilis]|uniref:Uncharacterized protein n=1 Tax=Roseiterribacter gracilis TaxID=2812848 RepID=A0A8S8XEQ1_9PROT|nr:hypothetical protein TMPK1_19530 [Rhodospirillales bacterium TMPK1]
MTLANPIDSLTLDFLAWIHAGQRSRDDVLSAWRSSCPRLTVWEDALAERLVQVEPTGRVALTERGRARMFVP